jgi:ubiquinone/menaquinone biosynthesis C-methylase UbiE
VKPHVCPWWGGYFIDNRLRRLLHKPEVILAPYIQPGMTVMDFGCGMGFASIAMARLVGNEGRVIAVDLQQKMLDVLDKRAVKAGVAERIDTHRCEPNSIGVDEPIDFALAFYSVHEAPDTKRVIAEVYELLRTAGQFLIVEPIGHVNKAEFENMLSLSQEVGFKVCDRPRIRFSRSVLLIK